MKSSKLVIQLLVLILTFFGCNSEDKPAVENPNQAIISRSDSSLINLNLNKAFIPIDSINFDKYPHLMELKAWVQDTITTSDWKIEYLVKNDSTIELDIYIKISKDGFENMYRGERLLEFRRYFIPRYLSETGNGIIMKHGCGTSCVALTVMSKIDSNLTETYLSIIDFNEERKILVHLTDKTYENEGEIFQIESVNLNSNLKSTLTLNNICTAVYKESCIDTIIYRKNEIEITTSLRENFEVREYSKQNHLMKI